MKEPSIEFIPEHYGGGDIFPTPAPATARGMLCATYVSFGEKVTLLQAAEAIEAAAVELGIALAGAARPMTDSFDGHRRVMRFAAPGESS